MSISLPNDATEKTVSDQITDNENLFIPVNKLDADQYAAEDLDGVTEGVFGSGNMAYASMQASQASQLLTPTNTSTAQDTIADAVGGESMTSGIEGNSIDAPSASPNFRQSNTRQEADATDTDRPIEQQGLSSQESGINNEGNFTNSTVGSTGTSSVASGGGGFGGAGKDGKDGQDGISTSSQDGADGTNSESSTITTRESHTQDGTDGQNGTTYNYTYNTTNNTYNTTNTTNNDTEVVNFDVPSVMIEINQTLEIAGDIVTNITHNVTDISSQITELLTSVTNNSFESINQITTQVTELATQISESLLSNITQITQLTSNVTNLLDGLLFSDDGLNLQLDAQILDVLSLNTDITLNDLLSSDIDIQLDLLPILEVGQQLTGALQELTGIDVLDTALEGLGSAIQPLQDGLNALTTQLSDLTDLSSLSDIGSATDAIDSAAQTVAELTDTLDGAIDGLLDASGLGTGSLIDTIVDIATGAASGAEGALDAIGDATALSPVTDSVGDVLTGAVDGVSDLLDGAGNDGLPSATDAVGDILAGDGGGLLGGLGGFNNDGGQDSDITTNLGVEALNHGIIEAVTDIALDPIEDLAGDIDLDIAGGLGLLNPSNTDNASGDTDIFLTPDIDLIDNDLLNADIEIPLDPVEQVTGDIDLDIGAAIDVLGQQADGIVNDGQGGTEGSGLLGGLGNLASNAVQTIVPELAGSEQDASDVQLDLAGDALATNIIDTQIDSVLDPVEAIIGDIDAESGLSTDLLNHSTESENTNNASGDSDLTLDADIDIANIDIVNIEADIPLDAVESITGDIDLEVDTALNLLGQDNSGTEAGTEGHWTESTLVDGGGLFGDLTGGMAGNDDLPDPTATVAEGLGALNVDADCLPSVGNLL